MPKSKKRVKSSFIESSGVPVRRDFPGQDSALHR